MSAVAPTTVLPRRGVATESPRPWARMLAAHHASQLAASCISPEIVQERGYYSVFDRTDLGHMSQAQQRLTPALAIPIYRLGEPYTLMTRPDTPRILTGPDGKERTPKYEWPGSISLCLDVLPRFKAQLVDPAIDLWISEGAKKSDAVASISQAVVTANINGVWGWGKKNADGDHTLLPDFNEIALRGRNVVLAFDSDYQVNEHVRQALHTFARLLIERGARVGILQLPHGAKKLGVDDAIAAGWTFATLEQAICWLDGDDWVPELERRRRETQWLHQQLQRQSARIEWMLTMLGNQYLPSPERVTAVFTKNELDTAPADDDGSRKVRIWKIADESGQSTDTVGRHLKKLEKCGAWTRTVSRTADPETQQFQSEVRLLPAAALDTPLELKPPEPKKWGGTRPQTCESCGSEEFIERKIVVCAKCGVMHGEPTERVLRAPASEEPDPEAVESEGAEAAAESEGVGAVHVPSPGPDAPHGYPPLPNGQPYAVGMIERMKARTAQRERGASP